MLVFVNSNHLNERTESPTVQVKNQFVSPVLSQLYKVIFSKANDRGDSNQVVALLACMINPEKAFECVTINDLWEIITNEVITLINEKNDMVVKIMALMEQAGTTMRNKIAFMDSNKNANGEYERTWYYDDDYDEEKEIDARVRNNMKKRIKDGFNW